MKGTDLERMNAAASVVFFVEPMWVVALSLNAWPLNNSVTSACRGAW